MLSLLFLTLSVLPLSFSREPPASLINSKEPLTILSIGNDTHPVQFYKMQTPNDLPNYGLVTAWSNPSQRPTWLRPVQPGNGIQLFTSAIQEKFMRLPPYGTVSNGYLTWGPEYHSYLNPMDTRIVVRQYDPEEWEPDAAPQRLLKNGELKLAAVTLGNLYEMGELRTEAAFQMCYVNAQKGLDWCSGVIMVQRDLWIGRGMGPAFAAN
ncbi:MAG: hypothetical protein Q9178_004616 [Gyalolechia marmorata]